MKKPSVLLADDHRLVAEGLRSLLEPHFELVGIVEDGQELVKVAQKWNPDIIVVDITMPVLNGLDAIDQLRREGCRASIVFLTMHRDVTYAARALKAGASAFVLKHSAVHELLTAIHEALEGRTYVTPAIAERLDALGRRNGLDPNEPLLTSRQRQVLQLFAEGHTARQVAEQLQISTRTAENHKAHIMQVLGTSSTTELVQYAIRHGLIRAD